MLLRCGSFAAPQPQKRTHKRTQRVWLDSRTAPHPCAVYAHCALCNRTMCLSSVTPHARHAHAQVTRETHHTRCTTSHFLSNVLLLPDRPPWSATA